MNCICRNRELVMELPSSAFSVRCAGCHGTVYGLEEEDCRQVRLPNMYMEDHSVTEITESQFKTIS
jgi:LSD1 subclass zinc finger protein